MRCWTSESLLKHVAHTHRCSSESWGSCSSWQPPAMTSKRWLPITVDPCRCCRGCSGIPSITEYNGRARISCAALRLRRGYDTSSPMQVSSTCVCVCARARAARVYIRVCLCSNTTPHRCMRAGGIGAILHAWRCHRGRPDSLPRHHYVPRHHSEVSPYNPSEPADKEVVLADTGGVIKASLCGSMLQSYVCVYIYTHTHEYKHRWRWRSRGR